jgi:peptidoglycan/xylan/chitin deacetylase (PgdA/CDA1 family)
MAQRIGRVQPGFRILMYHAVGTPIPEDRLGLYTLAPENFAGQVQAVAEDTSMPVRNFGEAADAAQGLAITFDDGYRDALTAAAPLLARFGLPFTVFVTTDYVRSGDRIYLTPQELRELAACPGATIGSHGVSHARLVECPDATLRNELADSRSYLEDLLQRPVTTLSYPHGAADRRVRDAAEAAGYELAACSRFGTNRGDRDPLLLLRTDIWSVDGLDVFRSKVAGNWDWMGWRT